MAMESVISEPSYHRRRRHNLYIWLDGLWERDLPWFGCDLDGHGSFVKLLVVVKEVVVDGIELCRIDEKRKKGSRIRRDIVVRVLRCNCKFSTEPRSGNDQAKTCSYNRVCRLPLSVIGTSPLHSVVSKAARVTGKLIRQPGFELDTAP